MPLNDTIARLKELYSEAVIEQWLLKSEKAVLKRLSKPKTPPKKSLNALANAILKTLSREEIARVKYYALGGL